MLLLEVSLEGLLEPLRHLIVGAWIGAIRSHCNSFAKSLS